MSDKICEVCGSNRRVFFNKETNQVLCDTHRTQVYRNGKVLKRTLKDRNEIVIVDNHAEIILYDINNDERDRAIIDINDIDLVKDKKWALHQEGYAVNTTGYKECMLLYRLIMKYNGEKEVDHINRDRLDCRKNNLRICEPYENGANKGISPKNTSGVTGVCWDKARNKWAVIITCNKKTIHLGRFNNFEDAVKTRRDAEVRYFGEFNPNKELLK